MPIAKIALAASAALTLVGLAGAASADTPWEHRHPRQDEVLDRTRFQEHRIAVERREGEISPWQARRLDAVDYRIARQDHWLARMNGGYITRGEQRYMNHEENRQSWRIGW